ncbi:microtubule cross-linking factor 2 [Stigmatopora nigra]
MTKSKEVDVQKPPAHLSFASPKERRLHLRHKMESGGGGESSDSGPTQHAEMPAMLLAQAGKKKKTHRAPSPARPKDVPGWSLAKIRGGMGVPGLNVKPGALHISRRSPIGSVKDGKSASKTATGKSSACSPVVSAVGKAKSSGGTGARRKASDASIASDDLSKDSGCGAGKMSLTDSGSELSECGSDEHKLSSGSDAESRSSRGGGPEGDNNSNGDGTVESRQPAKRHQDGRVLCVEAGEQCPGEERSMASVPASTSLAFSDLTEELVDGMHEELVREIEELRSENDYLKDEMEELRSEMLEMRDMYMEDDVYQLQELRQQLEQANKTCRILQYRLRKAERRSLRVAQTGQVDGELIRTLEQDVKVAKDVSIRLHSQLDSGEKKRARLEDENEELRVRLQDLEVAKQVLQQEIDKNCQKKRGARPNNKSDKKLVPQEDSSDLKCQLHFAKEESALMCKKLTKLVKDSEAMKEELAKYRSLYGDVDASITIEEVADSPHTREAEVRVHLKLVEEEANLLSRRIVELEVENRGLRAEMDDMKGPPDGPQELSNASASPGTGPVGAPSENVMELQRHLQFVEEEAELLRRSLIEMEEQNKLLMNEINRYKSELPPPTMTTADPLSSVTSSLSDRLLYDGALQPAQEAAVLISPDVSPLEEELGIARHQIGELSGKVKKLQYENRVLLSNLQQCDLASYQPQSAQGMDEEEELGDSSQRGPKRPPQRKEPLGVENVSLESSEQNNKMAGKSSGPKTSRPTLPGFKDNDVLLAMRDQARLISTAIQLLTAPESNCRPSSPSIHHGGEGPELCDMTKVRPHNQISELSDLADRPLVGALTSRLQALHGQLQVFVEGVDNLGKASVNGGEAQSSSASAVNSSPHSEDHSDTIETAEEKQPDCRDPLQLGLDGQIGETDHRKTSQRQNEEKEETPNILEEQQKALLQLQTLGLQAGLQRKLWDQERTLLAQESQHLKQALLLLSLKLRCFLKNWRLGSNKDTDWKDILEMNNLKDLYLLLEEDNLASPGKMADGDQQTLEPAIKTSTVSSTLADIKVALRELSGELRQERQGSQELTQQFAKAKASWEVQRTQLKGVITQLESKAVTPSSGDAMETSDFKMALTREREEHQHLLAESYAAVMDLTKQLQIGERNWGREKMEMLERFSQERAQWENRLRETKSKSSCAGSSADGLVPNRTGSPRTKSNAELDAPELQSAPVCLPTVLPNFICPPLSDTNKKNWTCLNNQSPDVRDPFKTWDGPSASNLAASQLDLESVPRSHTAPESTGIRMYYSPPAVRRTEPPTRPPAAQADQTTACFSWPYEGWLSSLSEQHRELLESRSASADVSVSSDGAPDGRTPAAFRGLEMGEISANLSDDMKEMTNCVRQAIRSSSLERKSAKEPAVSRSTQTAAHNVSIGLQTDNLVSGRGAALHAKAWSPRPSSVTGSPLASARSRHMSTSLDKVHCRIERPCCSPKFGSPKLQRRVSSGSASRLDGTRERSLWNLGQRSPGGGGGSAWARSTTTRDSPVLSGLTDGLSSLFSVVEHSGSMEALWRADAGAGVARQPAGKPSCASDSSPQRMGGLVHDFIHVCGARGRGERAVGGSNGVDEPVAAGALAGLSGGTDHVTGIVNKRFMRQPAGDETDGACDCTTPTHCPSRPSRGPRGSPAHCKHRSQEWTPASAEEKADISSE